MKQFKMTIRMDNDAFFGQEVSQLADILREAAQSLFKGQIEGQCIDDNGNTVGSWAITEEE